MTKNIINIAEVELRPRPPEYAATGPAAQRFDARVGTIGKRIGARKLGYNVTAVPPGKRAYPFHNHHANEEMFYVIEGTGEVRIGKGRVRIPGLGQGRRLGQRAALRRPARSAGRLLGRRVTLHPGLHLLTLKRRRLKMSTAEVKSRRAAGLKTPTNLGADATRDISGALNLLLADLFALYLKTKNFHWHVSGPHFRDYHLLLDEQADQIYAITDPVAERVRKVGGTTLRSIGQIGRSQRILDNDADYVSPLDMLAELRDDNMRLAASMRETHGVCDERGDVATASLLEVWIDEAERRVWFLFEASRRGDTPGR